MLLPLGPLPHRTWHDGPMALGAKPWACSERRAPPEVLRTGCSSEEWSACRLSFGRASARSPVGSPTRTGIASLIRIRAESTRQPIWPRRLRCSTSLVRIRAPARCMADPAKAPPAQTCTGAATLDAGAPESRRACSSNAYTSRHMCSWRLAPQARGCERVEQCAGRGVGHYGALFDLFFPTSPTRGSLCQRSCILETSLLQGSEVLPNRDSEEALGVFLSMLAKAPPEA